MISILESAHLSTLSDAVRERLERYRRAILSRNEDVNLIATSTIGEFESRHLLDSLAPLFLGATEPGAPAKFVDIGSGGGFPGAPLAAARPEWSVTLIDAIRKKSTAVQESLVAAGISNAQVLWGRAEELARDPLHRESYDLATARALSSFNTSLELTLPFLKIGGLLWLYRGPAGRGEAEAATRALGLLGGRLRSIHPYRLSPSASEWHIICIEKSAQIQMTYPRRTGVPERRPIE